MGCLCVGVVMWLHPLVDELNDLYPAYWSNSRQGLGADLLITGLPRITFHKCGKDRLTVRVDETVVMRDLAIDRVPSAVITYVWCTYADYIRHDRTPPALPPWLVEPMAALLAYAADREKDDAVTAYDLAIDQSNMIREHAQKMKGL